MSEKEWIKKQIMKDTLGVFRVGCDEKNYIILVNLPNTIHKLETILNLKTKSVNHRVNELVRHGLATRRKGEGKVFQTELTKILLEIINRITEEVEKNVPRYIS